MATFNFLCSPLRMVATILGLANVVSGKSRRYGEAKRYVNDSRMSESD